MDKKTLTTHAQRAALALLLFFTILTVSGRGQAPSTDIWGFDARSATGEIFKFQLEETGPEVKGSLPVSGYYDEDSLGRMTLKGKVEGPGDDEILFSHSMRTQTKVDSSFGSTLKRPYLKAIITTQLIPRLCRWSLISRLFL